MPSMTEQTNDGFCPSCCALADEACHRPDGSPRPDHKHRHPMPRTEPDDLTDEEVRELAETVPGIERFYGLDALDD